jgi:F-type H+-transporting ATPase subunit b
MQFTFLIGFIIAQVAIFTTIIIVLKRVIFHDANSAVNRLARLDDLNREKERQLVERLDETERLLQQKKDELKREENRMRMEAERAALQLHETIVMNAKKEAEEIIKKALAARDKMKTDAQIEAESKTVDFCKQLLWRVLTPIVSDLMHERLIKEFVEELQKTDMSVVSRSIKQVDVYVAKKMPEEYAYKLRDVLAQKLERPIDLKLHEDPALIGGVLLKFGTLVIDESLLEHINLGVSELKEQVAVGHRQPIL